MFPKNEGTVDRAVRTVAGGSLLVASFTAFGIRSAKPLGVLSAHLGAVLLFTAAAGSCPLYRLIRVTTAKSS